MAEKQWEVVPPESAPRGGTSGASTGRGRLAVAFGVAAVSDLLSIWMEFLPPAQWALDLATAGALYLALGRQWLLLPALVTEAIPGLALFPTWLLVVLSIATWGTIRGPAQSGPG
jgi:hypothetical protein